jgi:hypothetical protein
MPEMRDGGGADGLVFHGVIRHRANDYESLDQSAVFVV